VILKPSERAPLSALLLAELAAQAGLPDGVLNVLPGSGDVTGHALAVHPGVDAIAFTGSTAIGKYLLECAGRSNMKKVSLECGGKRTVGEHPIRRLPAIRLQQRPVPACLRQLHRPQDHLDQLRSLITPAP